MISVIVRLVTSDDLPPVEGGGKQNEKQQCRCAMERFDYHQTSNNNNNGYCNNPIVSPQLSWRNIGKRKPQISTASASQEQRNFYEEHVSKLGEVFLLFLFFVFENVNKNTDWLL